ncbi:protein angel homolog 2-like isoform X2 [Ylistrum balloti]|nr:protein angel homolog 2-like isoform X2 [Ylistrum balloti]XP_060070893.1 protein angel homolog 2-like isoform X2 [Ylistrum balloti]
MDAKSNEAGGMTEDGSSSIKSQKRRYCSGSSSTSSQLTDVIREQMCQDDPAIIDLTVDNVNPVVIDLTGTSDNRETNKSMPFRDLDSSAVNQVTNNPMGSLFARLKDSKQFESDSHSSYPRQFESFSEIENKARQCSLNPPSKKHKTEDKDLSQEDKDQVPYYPSYKSKRTWEWTTTGRQCLSGRLQHHGTDFTVMSYNVLAQNLLEDNMYLYYKSEEKYLQWNYRKHLLLREIQEHLPDILCLQEVNEEHYKSFFTPELAKLGYKGEYQKRTGDDKFDGCATFYKTSEFKMVKCSHLCYYRQFRILDRDNVAMIMKLQPVNQQKHPTEVCVANTHLLFNPRRGDVKLAQIVLLLAEINKLTHTVTARGEETHIPTIVCGDFNLVPKSKLYKFLASGYIQFEGLLAKTMSGQTEGRRGMDMYLPRNFLPFELNISNHCTYYKENQFDMQPSNQKSSSQDHCQNELPSSSSAQNPWDIQRITSEMGLDTGCLWHHLVLKSSYRHWIERLGKSASEVTTHHGNDSSIVDFIFYNRNNGDAKEGSLTLLGCWGLMSEKELNQIGTFPCKNHPSDHLPLLSRFLLE